MFAFPLTPTSPRIHPELDCAPARTALPPKMGLTSYEHPSSPSVFTPTNMTQSRPQSTSQKRPKLSLQTSSLPITFGKSSTALATTASALPAASPTVLNTFNNAYDMPHRFSPATASPTGNRSARPSSRLVSPFALSKEDRPYQVTHGLKGILRNSPIPSSLRRSSFCPASESPRTGRRALFPAAKKVIFHTVLEEEIKTSTYTAKHSDLSSDDEEPDSDAHSDLSLSSSDESEPDETPIEDTDAQIRSSRRKRKARSDRQIEAVAIRDGIGEAERIQKRLKATPNSRRKRRRRQWEWTLEPLKKKTSSPKDSKHVSLPDNSLSRIALPPSATSSSLDTKTKTTSPLLAQIALPPSATLPSPESPSRNTQGGI